MNEEPEQGELAPVEISPENAQAEPNSKRATLHARPPGVVRVVLCLCVLLALVMGVLGLLRYSQSAQFHERARQFVVARIERVTGGRVELQSVEWKLAHLQFELAGLTIHGKEAAASSPLLRVERVQAQVKWSPLLHGRVRLHELSLLHPLVHVEVYEDGSTNLPRPVLARGMPANASIELLRLAMDHAALIDGLLEWNDDKIKLSGAVEAVVLDLSYNAADQDYNGAAKVGQIHLRLPQTEPITLGAEANFCLLQNRVEVPRLRVSSGNSWVEAAGALTGLASPVAQFSYRAVGDLADLARLTHHPELRAGALQFSGEATYRWDRGEYAAVGGARAADVTWVNPVMRLEHISGGFTYSLDRDRFNVSAIFATLLGGTAHGTLRVDNLRGEDSAGSIALEVTGVELAQALRAFSTGGLPLDRLHLAGSTASSLKANWRGALRNARLQANFRVQPLKRAGELPVQAAAQATVDFQARTGQLRSLEASTPASHLSANGRLSADSELKVELNSADLSELAPMVASWRGPRAKELPIDFAGRAQFHGIVRNKLSHTTASGHLELHDFTTVLRRWANPSSSTQPTESFVRTRWDLLGGDIEYSSTRESLHNGTLRHGGARIGIDASVALVNGDYDATQPFAAHVRLENVEATDLQGLAASSYPVTGKVSGEVQVGGTASHLNGSGHIAIRNGTAWKQTLRSATAAVSFTENQALLRNIQVNSDAMQLSGDARINVETSEFGFDLKGTEVKLENLRAVRERKIPVTGQATFDASGEGTPDAPVINGHLRLRNLALNRQSVGSLNVDAVTHGTEMTLTARSNFKAAEFKLDGQVHLRDQMPMRLAANLQSADLNPLFEAYLPIHHGAASELKMHVDASGELRHPADITAEAVVEHWATNYGGVAVINDGPIRLHLADQIVRVEQFRMAGEQGTRFLQVGGQVQLGGKRELDLHAGGSLDIKLLEITDPNLRASGVANLDLRVNGTLSRPAMSGSLNVQNATINYSDFPNGLSDITGTLDFNQDRLQVRELTARTGGGLLHCGGFIAFASSQGVGFSLTASGRDIRLRYPEGLSSTADASFALTGTMKNALLSGSVTVTRLALNPQFDFASYLVAGMRGAPAQKSDSPLNNVHLDVHVTSTPELQVQTSLARLSGNVDLRMRGPVPRPVVLGRVNLLEGTIDFNGTKYRIERGDVTFTNPVRIEPALDVELSARVRDYDITLGFHGPINRLTPSYRSDPPLSSSDIISLLALGSTAAESANPALVGTARYQPEVSESASSALIGQALNDTVNSRVQKLFGVSRVKIDPNVGGALNAGLARVTVEQQASNDLTITYITNLNQSAQQIIQIEYNLNKDVSIVGVRDQTGVVSFDVLFRKRKK